MEVINIYQKEFRRKLLELGFIIREVSENTFRLDLNKDRLNTITAKLIGSKPIIEKLHGSKNNIEIKAIGYFKFKLPPENNEPNFYIFAFGNPVDNKIEFVIVSFTELRNRLNQRKCITDKDHETELKLWLLPDYDLFDTTNFGAEGEWYFIGGKLAQNTNWDYTSFLNGWDLLHQA